MIKRNNPGNIRPSKDFTWQGTDPVTPVIGGFVNFLTLEAGVRALVKNIVAHIRKGNNTPSKLIGGSKAWPGWAPSSDNNDVPLYLRTIKARVSLDPNHPLTTKSWEEIGKLALAITFQEHGSEKAVLLVKDALEKTDGKV